jgi:hypothetical protein
MGLRILITNNALTGRGGSELYVRDVALGLRQRGHDPVVYSTILGQVAKELQAESIQVVDDLNQLDIAPDLIHGHHHMETMTALLFFPNVPAINFCHSATHWHETPVSFPRVWRYVAVDHACRDRLQQQHAIPVDRIRVLLNFVDLSLFKMRSAPLPAQPQRALVFSNYANAETHLPAVREACRRVGIPLDVLGGSQNGVAGAAPEAVLGTYDLVFAKARCALEAMAVGAAVILCDEGGLGPLVTVREFEQLRPLNFGIRTLRSRLDPDILVSEIERYDAADAADVCRLVRSTASHESVVDDLVSIYEEVIEEHRQTSPADIEAEGRAAANYLRQLKIDFATHGAASMRLREQLQKFPVVGRFGVKLARRLTRYPGL